MNSNPEWLASLRAEHKRLMAEQRAAKRKPFNRTEYMREWRAKQPKKKVLTPEERHSRRLANGRKSYRKKVKELRHQRWLDRREQARLKREALAARRAEREKKAALQAEQDYLKQKKLSPFAKRHAEEVAAALAEGIRVGRQMERDLIRAEQEQTQRQEGQ